MLGTGWWQTSLALRYIKDWVCKYLIQKVMGVVYLRKETCDKYERLGHGLYPVDIVLLALMFPWHYIAWPIKVLLPVFFFRASTLQEKIRLPAWHFQWLRFYLYEVLSKCNWKGGLPTLDDGLMAIAWQQNHDISMTTWPGHAFQLISCRT